MDSTTISLMCVCVNCSNPIIQSNEDVLNEILSKSPTSSRYWTDALNSVFKLNYLDAFHQEEEENLEILLCHSCDQIIRNLYQLYNDFLQLGKIDSYLSKKITKLDEIIDSHRQKVIHCDFIISPNNEKVQKGNSHFVNASTKPLIYDGREPRIVLTRLPEILPDFPSSSYNDDVQSEPEVKIKVEEEDSVMDLNHDDDGNFTEESTCSPKPRKTFKSRRKNKTVRSSCSSTRKKKVQQQQQRVRKQSSRVSAKIATISISEMTREAYDTPKRKESEVEDDKSTKRKRQKDGKSTAPSTRKKNFYDHMKTRNYLSKRAKYPNPCWYCKRRDFLTPADCVQHTITEHLPKQNNILLSSTHVCQRCSRICVGEMSLNFHLKRCELIPSGVILPKKFPCLECSKLFFSKDEVNTHMLHHSNERPFPCDECPYRAKIMSALKSHKVNKHLPNGGESGDQNFVCPECGKPQKNEKMLTWHKWAFHTDEGNQKYKERLAMTQGKRKEKRVNATPISTFCEDCNIDLFARLALINHRRSFHGDNMGKIFVCEICGRDFSRAHSLKLHTERVHSDERPYVCHICGRAFKVNYNLKAHVEQTHTEEGRLKYNKRMRESNRRMKLRANQLASVERMQMTTECYGTGEVLHENPS